DRVPLGHRLDDRMAGEWLPAARLVGRGCARVPGGGGRHIRLGRERGGGLSPLLITHGCSAPWLARADPARLPGRVRPPRPGRGGGGPAVWWPPMRRPGSCAERGGGHNPTFWPSYITAMRSAGA